MAGRAVSRVFVASGIRDLAKHVQLLLPSMKVEELQINDEKEYAESEEWAGRLKEVEVLMCDGSILVNWLKTNALPNLKWAHSTWAGVDTLLKAFSNKKPKEDLIVTRSGAFGDIMGEYVVGQIIAWERNFSGMRAAQEKKIFDKRFGNFRPLNSLSIGILGYGVIGKRVSEMCKAMGLTVWAVNRVQNSSPSPHVDHFRGMDSLPEVLRSVDYLVSILPDTPHTRDLLSGHVLQPCANKKTVFINIGRGNVISDQSLIEAVSEGWLGGAILDVFNQEPLPPDSELWTLPNVVITPHVAGISQPQPVSEFFVRNVKLYAAGQPLLNVFDWEKGY